MVESATTIISVQNRKGSMKKNGKDGNICYGSFNRNGYSKILNWL